MKPPSMADEAAFVRHRSRLRWQVKPPSFFGAFFPCKNQGAGDPDRDAVPLGNLLSSDYELVPS